MNDSDWEDVIQQVMEKGHFVDKNGVKQELPPELLEKIKKLQEAEGAENGGGSGGGQAGDGRASGEMAGMEAGGFSGGDGQWVSAEKDSSETQELHSFIDSTDPQPFLEGPNSLISQLMEKGFFIDQNGQRVEVPPWALDSIVQVMQEENPEEKLAKVLDGLSKL